MCWETIHMKYEILFAIFEKLTNLKMLSAANYRWRRMCKL